MHAGANCVAVESTCKGRAGPPLGCPRGAAAFDDDTSWILDVLPFLKSQDNGYFYKKHIATLSAAGAPLVCKHRTGLSKGLIYGMLVSSNAVSVQAAQLLRALLREQDNLFIVHFVQERSQVGGALHGFLKQFEVRGAGHALRITLAATSQCWSGTVCLTSAILLMCRIRRQPKFRCSAFLEVRNSLSTLCKRLSMSARSMCWHCRATPSGNVTETSP
jgi:hypothetical protein